MRADVNGDVEILGAFWNRIMCPPVPPVLAYADLTDNRRENLEAAKMI
jgi:hypothetical protein